MASWTRILPLALVAACSTDPQVELMLEVGIGVLEPLSFLCADGTMVSATAAQADDVRQCLGLGCGGRYEAGSADCQDPVKNPAAGTCVEAYFACAAPSGACTGDRLLGWTYANGARGAFPAESGDMVVYSAAGEECVVRTKTGYGSPEENTYVRPL